MHHLWWWSILRLLAPLGTDCPLIIGLLLCTYLSVFLCKLQSSSTCLLRYVGCCDLSPSQLVSHRASSQVENKANHSRSAVPMPHGYVRAWKAGATINTVACNALQGWIQYKRRHFSKTIPPLAGGRVINVHSPRHYQVLTKDGLLAPATSHMSVEPRRRRDNKKTIKMKDNTLFV